LRASKRVHHAQGCEPDTDHWPGTQEEVQGTAGRGRTGGHPPNLRKIETGLAIFTAGGYWLVRPLSLATVAWITPCWSCLMKFLPFLFCIATK